MAHLNKHGSNHPLEYRDIEEINLSFSNKSNSPQSINRGSADIENNYVNIPTKTGIDQQSLPFKPKVPKRIAPRILPRIPDKYLNSENKNSIAPKEELTTAELNFYIPIDNVGWFYKKDQEINALKAQNSCPTNLDELNSIPTNETNLNSNNSNSNPNVSSNKKWIMFNKLDSFNLEVEYRSMQTQADASEPKLVQVLDDLYEVNLTTRKCYAIYWKGKSSDSWIDYDFDIEINFY